MANSAQNQLFYLGNNLGLACGECIPGTAGSDRYLENLSLSATVIESCTSLHTYPYHVCSAVGLNPRNMFRIYCQDNEYCTPEGLCENIKKRDDFGTPCTSGKCNNGLQCIRGVCIQCEHGANLGHVKNDQYLEGFCVDKQWTQAAWKKNQGPTSIFLGIIIGMFSVCLISKTTIIQFLLTKLFAFAQKQFKAKFEK